MVGLQTKQGQNSQVDSVDLEQGGRGASVGRGDDALILVQLDGVRVDWQDRDG